MQAAKRRKSLCRNISAALVACSVGVSTTVIAPQTARAQVGGPITVLLNGLPIDFSGAAPAQVEGRVLVPLRSVFEALGATVSFDAETQNVFATRGNTEMQLTLGSTQASVNGETRTLDVPAQARFGRTLVPLRFVSEALGADVSWNDAQRTVFITAAAPSEGTTIPTRPPFQPPANPPYTTPTPPSRPPYTAPTGDLQVVGTVVKVDANPPATLTVGVNNRLRTFNLSTNAQISRRSAAVPPTGSIPAYAAPITLADVGRLVPGEEVRVSINDQDEATQIISYGLLATARVRYAQDNQIVLEDTAGTTLPIGPSLRYIDALGRSAARASLAAGTPVALFIAPTSRLIYQVSAFNADLAIAADPSYRVPTGGSTTYPPGSSPSGSYPPGTTPPGIFPPGNIPPNTVPVGTPIINLVQHNAIRPLRNGGQFTVTVRGSERARASFSIIPGAPEQPLQEDPNTPGLYTGQYTVRAGDNILSGRVTAFLRNEAGQEASQQSRTPVTIDTVLPRITTTAPPDGANVASTEPNIVVYANDIGGSGLARATAVINGQPVSPEEISVSPTSVSIVPNRPLAGQVTVRVNVADAANNSASTTFSFFADTMGGTNFITSVTHNATRALQPGDVVQVSISAPAGGRASIDVVGSNNRVVAQNIPATEIAAGRYRANYTIQANTTEPQLLLRARFVDATGRISAADAAAPVALTGDTTGPVTIVLPLESDRVASPLVIRGRANPNATVEIAVTAQGVRYFVFEYKTELATQQVQADLRGEWATPPINLPRPNNVSNITYSITAAQTDAAGRRSEPVTVTVAPR